MESWLVAGPWWVQQRGETSPVSQGNAVPGLVSLVRGSVRSSDLR